MSLLVRSADLGRLLSRTNPPPIPGYHPPDDDGRPCGIAAVRFAEYANLKKRKG